MFPDPAAGFDCISAVNVRRARRWHSDGHGEAHGEASWTKGDWGCALAGEVGELCNLIKKIRRIETGVDIARPREHELGPLLEQCRGEIADIYLYLDLLRDQLLPDDSMFDIIAEKFNQTSADYGFPEVIKP